MGRSTKHSDQDEPQEHFSDWELVDRLKRIAESDETEEIQPHPELPHAPTLPDLFCR